MMTPNFILLTTILVLFPLDFTAAYMAPGFRSDRQVLRELKRENHTIIGDMLLPPFSPKRSAWLLFDNWPNARIPYVISDNVTDDLVDTIAQAITYYETYTCLRFLPADPNSDTYWVRFLLDPALAANPDSNLLCSAVIGFQNRKDQAVLLGKKCNFGSMVHELEHTLGFLHEHARTDRDQYLQVYEENMQDIAISQFKRQDIWCRDLGGRPDQCRFDNYGLGFNYDSIMNYCTYCGSKNGLPVMRSRNNTRGSLGDASGRNLGQMVGFSVGDWLAVNRKYNCTIASGGPEADVAQPPPLPTDPEKPNPFPTPKPCRRRPKSNSDQLKFYH